MTNFRIVFRDQSRDDLVVDGDYLKADDDKVQVMRQGSDRRLPGPAAAMGIGDKAVFVAPLAEGTYAREESAAAG